jgi:hypothetical protein
VGDDQILSVDEALAEIASIIDRLDSMGSSDPARPRLVARRDELRKAARDAAVASRSDDTLRYERDQAQRRVDELDKRLIKPGWSERQPTKWINDPGAYSARINEMLREQDATERAELERRIADITRQLEQSDAP